MTRLVLLAGLALAGSVLAYSLAGAADLTGHAVAIDGDTIVIGATHIRLAEIDAPERAQTCNRFNVPVFGTAEWQCGRFAAYRMSKMLLDPVTCTPRATDRYGRT